MFQNKNVYVVYARPITFSGIQFVILEWESHVWRSETCNFDALIDRLYL